MCVELVIELLVEMVVELIVKLVREQIVQVLHGEAWDEPLKFYGNCLPMERMVSPKPTIITGVLERRRRGSITPTSADVLFQEQDHGIMGQVKDRTADHLLESGSFNGTSSKVGFLSNQA